MKQLIEQDSNGPIVDGKVILLLKNHFRCHVLVGPAEGFPFGFDVVSSPSQIADFDVAGIVKKNVLGLSER